MTADAAEETVEVGTNLGYYLIYAPELSQPNEHYAGSVCSLTSTAPNATVNIKAGKPTVEKEVDDTEVEVGQTVHYTITGEVPNTAGYNAYTYKLTDTMTSGLTFDLEDADFTVPLKKTGKEDVVLTDTHYTVTQPAYTNGFECTIDVKNLQDYVGYDIVVTYSAVVNDQAVINQVDTNTYELEYTNKSDGTIDNTPEENVKIYTCKIIINKYDGANSTKLANAQFVLYKLEGEGESAVEKYYKYTAATGDAAAKVEWVDSIDDATVKTTNDDGAASFDGVQEGTYYLEETVAPNGYNLLSAPVEVIVTSTPASGEAAVTCSATADVANNAGTVLPETGGMGTTIFYIVGGLMMTGAVVLLVTKKKMSAKAE